jgi:hypothetical protein
MRREKETHVRSFLFCLGIYVVIFMNCAYIMRKFDIQARGKEIIRILLFPFYTHAWPT